MLFSYRLGIQPVQALGAAGHPQLPESLGLMQQHAAELSIPLTHIQATRSCAAPPWEQAVALWTLQEIDLELAANSPGSPCQY